MHKVTPFHLAIPTTVRAACLQTWLTSLNNADFSKNLSIFDVAGPQKYNKLKKRGNFVQAVMRSRNIKSLTTLSHTKKEPLDHWVSSENLISAKSAKFCRKLSVFAQTEFIGAVLTAGCEKQGLRVDSRLKTDKPIIFRKLGFSSNMFHMVKNEFHTPLLVATVSFNSFGTEIR